MDMLSSHANVYNTCLLILRERGYKLRVEGEQDGEGMIIPTSLNWVAIDDGYQMNADNPIELLGLVTIYELRKAGPDPKPYWWNVSGPDIYDELMDHAFPVEEENTGADLSGPGNQDG
jgi:hypothetical protein